MTNNGTMTIEVTPVINEAELEASAQKIADRVVELIREKFADVPRRTLTVGPFTMSEQFAAGAFGPAGAQVFAAPLGTTDFKSVGGVKGFEATGAILDEMAETAFVVEPAKAEPRVFNVGDAEPEDRDTITLVGTARKGYWSMPAGEATLKFGRHSKTFGDGGKLAWWQVTGSFPTHADWNYWLRELGPLTEVLPDAEPEPEPEFEPEVVQPRVFPAGSPEPAGVYAIKRTPYGTTWRKAANGYWTATRGRDFEAFVSWESLSGSDSTEVLDYTPEPVVWQSVADIPANVKFTDVDGDDYYTNDDGEVCYDGSTSTDHDDDEYAPYTEVIA